MRTHEKDPSMTQPFPLRRTRNPLLPITLLGVLLLAMIAGGSWAVAALPDLQVSTSDGVDTVNPGDTITYRVTVKNRSTTRTITVASVTNTLDPNVEFQEASDSGLHNAGTITWTGPITLSPGKQTFRYVTVEVASPLAAGTEIRNNATAQETGDPAPAPVTATTDVDTVLNVPPVAADATVETDEDTPLRLNLGSYVNDLNGDHLTFSITVPPTRGALTNDNGSVVYTPDANASYSDSFSYSVTDPAGGTASATISITVNPVNDPPVPGSDDATTKEDTTVTLEAADLLLNDTDIDGATLAVSGVHAASANGGSATLDAGTIVYQPALNFNGIDTVTYIVSDGRGATADGTIRISVTPVNDAPSFHMAPTLEVDEDAGLQSIAGWAYNILAGPADEAGQSLNFEVWNDNDALFDVAPSTAQNGTLSFKTVQNATGSAIVSVRLKDDGGVLDGGADTSTVQTFTITVGATPDSPIAADDTATTPAGTPINIAVLQNDSDPDNDQLSVVSVPEPANGTAVINRADNTVTFTPAPGFIGTTSFTYTIDDGTGRTATATVTVTVTRINNPPTAVDYTYTTNEDTVLSVGAATGLLSDASDPDNDQLYPVRVDGPSNGTLSVYTDGSFSYRPYMNFNGTDSFTFKVTDGIDASAVYTVTITVDPVNDPPSITTSGDPEPVLEDSGAYSKGWFSNIVPGPADESGQSVVRTVSYTNSALFSVPPRLADDGTLSFTPASNAFGESEVTVVLEDNGGTERGGVNRWSEPLKITVRPVNDAPAFAKGADITVAEDSGVFSAAWATDISRGPANESDQSLTFTLSPTNSSLFAVRPALSANGRLTFTPAPNAYGSTVVTVVLNDGGGTAHGGQNTATATFTITITPVADPPVAGLDTVSALSGQPLAIAASTLLHNDFDPDGDTVTLASVSATSSAGGTAALSGDTVIYTSAARFVGDDTFTYVISDGKGHTATGTVTVKVMSKVSYSTFIPMVVTSAANTPAPSNPEPAPSNPEPTPSTPPAVADLVGSFTLSPAKTSFNSTEQVVVTATVTNQGTAAAGPFWVDFYINPSKVPTTTNIAWNTVCTQKPCQGIAWYVKDGLAPGQSITLTSTSGSYMDGYTIWSGQLGAGTTDLYLYVDSWNPGVATGGVAESNENNNRAELHNVAVTGAALQSTDVADAAELPIRPAKPSN